MAVISTTVNEILLMQEDLYRALKQPAGKRHWVMVIDRGKCTGCHACTVACIAENKLPPGVVYRPVIDQETGVYPRVGRSFLPRPCMHCNDAPCVTVCPVGASFRRDDGIIAIDYDKCIGCRYCIVACPYGARTFDFGEYYTYGTLSLQDYEKLPSFEYGKKRPRQGKSSPIGNVRKCSFCLHSLEAGMLPACVTSCIGHATYFGDINDPDSLIVAKLASPGITVLKPEMATKPNVYYLS